ncbi:MAG: hypothetical protein PHN56_02950 [Candidatus Nanoarchaeia archaeon]|nr:hypothetical protein [Candidatus Nanoarchaeia archaeon]
MNESHKYADGCMPIYQGSNNLVKLIYQREQGITYFNDNKPVLATFGLGPCLAIAGYDSRLKIGFLAHYDFLTNEKESIEQLIFLIPKNSFFDVSLIGGNDSSIEQYGVIKELLKNNEVLFNIIEEDVFGNISRSIVLDTRTGEKFAYNPKLFKNIKLIEPSMQVTKAKMII